MILAEMVDPANGERSFHGGRSFRTTLVPDDLGGIAGWVIEQCNEGSRAGGFVTKDLSKTVDFVRDTDNKWWEDEYS